MTRDGIFEAQQENNFGQTHNKPIPKERIIYQGGIKHDYRKRNTKYLKSTESNISKSNRKSKHKHYYEECLIQYRSTFIGKTRLNTGLYTYCIICGKINERFKKNKSIIKDYIREVNSPISKCYSHIPDEELYEKYHDKLPVFFVDFVEDVYKEKYVNLEQSGE